jgi:four helix bundle protein
MSGQSYRELLVWQKSMQLVTDTYLITESFPKNEMFGLTSQLKRAVVSIPSNIAEGQGRDSTKEFLYHLSVAYASLMEAETQIQIAVNLSFIEEHKANNLFQKCGEVGRMLNGLTRSLRKSLTDSKISRIDNRQLITDN